MKRKRQKRRMTKRKKVKKGRNCKELQEIKIKIQKRKGIHKLKKRTIHE